MSESVLGSSEREGRSAAIYGMGYGVTRRRLADAPGHNNAPASTEFPDPEFPRIRRPRLRNSPTPVTRPKAPEFPDPEFPDPGYGIPEFTEFTWVQILSDPDVGGWQYLVVAEKRGSPNR